MNHITRVTGITTLGLALLAAGPAIAHQKPSAVQLTLLAAGPTIAHQMPSAAQSAQNFSHKQLQSFADASTNIRSIRQSARQKVQQAGDRKVKMQIRKQAQEDMLKAVKDSGLTTKGYNKIARAARSNPQLVQKIQQLQ